MKTIAISGLFLALTSCGIENECTNSIVAEAPASNSTRTAVMFGRACGATTGFSTQVSLMMDSSAPTDAGNIFIADQGTRQGHWGGPWADVRWLPDGRLLIRYDANARVLKRASEFARTKIVYRAEAPTP